MVGRQGAIFGVIVTLLGLCLAQLVHKAWEADFSVMFGALLREHELVYLLDHLKVLLEHLSLADNAACDFSLDVSVLLHHITNLELQAFHILIICLQKLLDGLTCSLLIRL